jgi:Mrp family chromosome partitioning ATPase
MSRVTLALRNARAQAATDPARLHDAPTPDGTDRPGDGDAPWTFDDAAFPSDGQHTARGPQLSPGAGEGSPQSVAWPSTDDLTLLAQRLLQLRAGAGAVRSVLFCSAGPETSASRVCAGAAEAVARRMTGKVCLVDANLRSPSLTELLARPAARGLAEALLETGPIASFLTCIHDNLWLLPAGKRCAEAQAQLTMARFRSRLTELLAAVDFVLIAAASASEHPDAALLGPAVDGAILVIDAGATRRQPARHSAAALQSANVRLLGAVLTNRRFPIPEAVYRWI